MNDYAGFDYKEEDYTKLLDTVSPGLKEAQQAALTRLNKPAGVYEEDNYNQILEHLLKPTQEAAKKTADALTASFRARGMSDSGRHGIALLKNVQDVQREAASNIEVPLRLEQIRMQESTAQANINQAASLGVQGANLYGQMRTQAFGEKTQEAAITGQYAGQETLAAKAQRATQTGEYGGASDVRASDFGIDVTAAYKADGTPDMDKWFSISEDMDKTLSEAGVSVTGAERDGMIQKMMRGEAISLPFTMTLAAKAQASAQAIDWANLDVSRQKLELDKIQKQIDIDNAAMDRAIAQGTATGEFVDPVTKQSYETLAAKIQRQSYEIDRAQTYGYGTGGTVSAADLGIDVSGAFTAQGNKVGQRYADVKAAVEAKLREQGITPTTDMVDRIIKGQTVNLPKEVTLGGRALNMQEESQNMDLAITRANATGDFIDPVTGQSSKTLESKKFQLQQAQLTGLYEGEPTLQAQAQTWDQEHQDNAAFGFDRQVTNPDGTKSTQHVYGTNELQLAVQKNDNEFKRSLEAGFWYVDPSTGENRFVKGTDARLETDWQRQEHTRTGYDEVVYMEDGSGHVLKDGFGNPIARKDAAGNLVTKHIEGTQTMADRLQTRSLDLQEAGMEKDDAYRQSTLEWSKQQYEGYYRIQTIDLKGLGISGTGMDAGYIRQDGTVDFDAFFRWASDPINSAAAERLQAVLGTNYKEIVRVGTPANSSAQAKESLNTLGKNLVTLMQGGNVAILDKDGKPLAQHVAGTADLETQKIEMQETLQANGFTHDQAMQKSEQDYQDKLREGYWGPVDPKTGSPAWIRGTQDDQEYLMTLQNQFQTDAAGAQRIWDEQQRVGYDKTVSYTYWDAASQREVTRSRVVHVGGTQEFAASQTADAQEFAKTMQATADGLVREGWKQDAALQKAQMDHADRLEWGGFVMGQDGHLSWQPGRQDHEESLARLQDQAQADLAAAGYGAQAARDEAQYIRDHMVQGKAQLQTSYMTSRQWYYKNLGKSDAEASRLAGLDWDKVEGAFVMTQDGRPLTMQESLEQMQLDATANDRDAQREFDQSQTLMTVAATLGGDIWKLFNPTNLSQIIGGGLTREGIMALIPDSNMTEAQKGAVADRILAGAGGGATGMTPEQIAAANANIFARLGNGVTSILGIGTHGTGAAAGTAGAGYGALGTATGLAVAGLVVAGAWYGYNKVSDWWKAKKRRNTDERVAADSWQTDLSADDQKTWDQLTTKYGLTDSKSKDEIVEYFNATERLDALGIDILDLSDPDDTIDPRYGQPKNLVKLRDIAINKLGVNAAVVNGLSRTELRQRIADEIAAGDALAKFTTPANSWSKLWREWGARETVDPAKGGLIGVIAADARNLYVSGAFTKAAKKDYQGMLATDQDAIERIWNRLPGGSRSKDNATFEEKTADVAKFVEDMAILSPTQLREANGQVLSIQKKATGSLTRADKELVNSMWEQIGGDTNADFATRLANLPTKFGQIAASLPKSGAANSPTNPTGAAGSGGNNTPAGGTGVEDLSPTEVDHILPLAFAFKHNEPVSFEAWNQLSEKEKSFLRKIPEFKEPVASGGATTPPAGGDAAKPVVDSGTPPADSGSGVTPGGGGTNAGVSPTADPTRTAQVQLFSSFDESKLSYLNTNAGFGSRDKILAGLTSGELFMSQGGVTYPWSVLRRDGTEVARLRAAAATPPTPEPVAQQPQPPGPVSNPSSPSGLPNSFDTGFLGLGGNPMNWVSNGAYIYSHDPAEFNRLGIAEVKRRLAAKATGLSDAKLTELATALWRGDMIKQVSPGNFQSL